MKDAVRDLSDLIERQLIPVNGEVDKKLLTITGKLDSIKTALTSLGQLGPIASSIQALATTMEKQLTPMESSLTELMKRKEEEKKATKNVKRSAGGYAEE